MSTKATLSDYTIRLASESQKEEGLRAAFAHWGGSMTWEKFMTWWSNIEQLDGWLTEGYVRPWVLVRRDNFEGAIYSFCLTYRRKTLWKGPASAEVKESQCYAISAVVTPKQHHRNGFATHLLRLLHYYLASPDILPPFPTAEWGPAPRPLFDHDRAQVPIAMTSILFSGVGSTFYERATIGPKWSGWIIRDDEVQRITWKLAPRTGSKEGATHRDWLYTRDLNDIGKILSEKRREELSTEYQDSTQIIWTSDPASTGILAYVPSQVLRPRSEDFKTVYDTEPVGIRLPGLRPGQEECIVLFANSERRVGRGTLITYIHNLDPERLPILLEALDEAGEKAGLDTGIVWGVQSDSPLGQAWLSQDGRDAKAERREENSNLFGVAWYGKPEDRGKVIDTQIWNYC